MNAKTDAAAQAAQFNEAVQKFVPVCTSRFAKLLPFQDGIVVLRQKGASYRLVRELLAAAGVSVAVDTIGGFVREVIEQRELARPGQSRSGVRAVSGASARRVGRPVLPFTVAPPPDAAPDSATTAPKAK